MDSPKMFPYVSRVTFAYSAAMRTGFVSSVILLFEHWSVTLLGWYIYDDVYTFSLENLPGCSSWDF